MEGVKSFTPDRDLMTVHRFGQLVILLYENRFLAIGYNSGPHHTDVVCLVAGDRVVANKTIEGELRRLCASR